MLKRVFASLSFSDIVMPYAELPVAKTDPVPAFSIDNFLFTILSWNPSWLNEYGNISDDRYLSKDLNPFCHLMDMLLVLTDAFDYKMEADFQN